MTSSPPKPSFAPVSLSDLTPGSQCIVVSVGGTAPNLQQKLLTMGIVAGAVIELVAVAPLGDPITIKTKGYSLSLRRSEASGVTVMPIAAVRS